MDALSYDRKTILEKLKENRKKHEETFNEAEKGFKEAVVEELTEALELAKSGKEYRLILKLSQPNNYLKQYDRAIAMFEMSNQDNVELSENEFTQYVMDNWSWSNSFTETATLYGHQKLWKLGN